MNKVSVIVPAWNAKGYLAETIPALQSAVAHHGNAELIIVDNGSTDGTSVFARSLCPDAILVSCRRTTIGRARNEGAAAAKGTILAFVDADCVVAVDYLCAVEQVVSREGVSVAGGRYDLPTSPSWIEETWSRLHAAPKDRFVNYVPGGNLAIRRDAFEASSGFDEDLITGEDAEFCQRLRKAGYQIFAASSLRVAHLGNPKDVRGFFSREVWHALGMFGTAKGDWFDRPLLMTLLHLLLSIVVAVWIAATGASLPLALAAVLISQVAVPAATVLYRLVRLSSGNLPEPFNTLSKGIFLYWVYYWARAKAIFMLILHPAPEKYSKRT